MLTSGLLGSTGTPKTVLMDLSSLLKYVPIIGRSSAPPIVAVLRLSGPIGMPLALGRTLRMANLASPIERAFELKSAKAVALVINSPGGSAVQSALIHKRIRALAKEKNLPVFAFVEDVAASGGYILALAGDKIFADPSSIVGSIGVISAGFGFQELIKKIGVERRIYSAGERKSTLDPFRPESAEDVRHLKELQKEIHNSFMELVRKRRGELLKGDQSNLFSGEFWTGKQAETLGLIEGLGDMRSVMRERFGVKVRLKPVGGPGPWWRRRSAFSEGWRGPVAIGGGPWSDDLLATVEQRALWSRFGL